jgi:chaperone modulatory protein CbpM
MMRAEDLVAAIAALQMSELQRWVSEALVSPAEESGALLFSDAEAARVRLICTLRYEMDVEPATLPVVMSLLDQLYDTRRRLHALGAAVAAQEGPIRDAILKALEER